MESGICRTSRHSHHHHVVPRRGEAEGLRAGRGAGTEPCGDAISGGGGGAAARPLPGQRPQQAGRHGGCRRRRSPSWARYGGAGRGGSMRGASAPARGCCNSCGDGDGVGVPFRVSGSPAGCVWQCGVGSSEAWSGVCDLPVLSPPSLCLSQPLCCLLGHRRAAAGAEEPSSCAATPTNRSPVKGRGPQGR